MNHPGLCQIYTATNADNGERLDVFLTRSDGHKLSRSQLRRAIAQGQVCINDKPVSKAGVKLRPGDTIACEIPPPPATSVEPQNIPLEFLYEDSDLAVLIKPAGLVVHPAPGHPNGTLVNALLYHYQQAAQQLSPPVEGENAALRPGIVHRLDRETSGVMVVARSQEAMQTLAKQFAAHTIARRYLAIALPGPLGHAGDRGTFQTHHKRHPKDRMRYTGNCGGKRQATTHYEVLEKHKAGTRLVACTLETGRTHQIRMHLSEAGAPILGDPLYGTRRAQTRLIARQALHAQVLGFVHPSGESMRFEAEPPRDFQSALDTLRSGARP